MICRRCMLESSLLNLGGYCKECEHVYFETRQKNRMLKNVDALNLNRSPDMSDKQFAKMEVIRKDRDIPKELWSQFFRKDFPSYSKYRRFLKSFSIDPVDKVGIAAKVSEYDLIIQKYVVQLRTREKGVL